MGKKVELHVTAAGHKSPNKWKQGDKIKVHPSIAKSLIEKGLATESKVNPLSPKELADEAATKKDTEDKNKRK